MQPIDLEYFYEEYLQNTVKGNPQKYGDYEALEEDIAELYEKWQNLPDDRLDKKTPKQFIEALAKTHDLCDYVEDLLEAGVEVSDLACDALINDVEADELLERLCYSDLPDAQGFATEMLKLKGGAAADDIFIDALTNPNASEALLLASYEYLSDGQPQVVDWLLELLPTVEEDKQGEIVEILAEYKGNKQIYMWLITMLFRREDIPLYADLIAKYDDPSAIETLKGFALETTDINYMEYLELRYAVERLGGELDMDKDFSEDPLYKFQHDDEGGDKN